MTTFEDVHAIIARERPIFRRERHGGKIDGYRQPARRRDPAGIDQQAIRYIRHGMDMRGERLTGGETWHRQAIGLEQPAWSLDLAPGDPEAETGIAHRSGQP